jgi:magnesium chelatase family protein
MYFKNFSAAVFGIDAYLMEVEVDVGSGKPGDYNIGGLPDIAVKESRERIKAALKNCGHDFPLQSVTVNLAPADIRKEGSAFDLPMALSILGCEGAFFGKRLDQYIFLGLLSLDGQVRSVRARPRLSRESTCSPCAICRKPWTSSTSRNRSRRCA